MIPRTAEMRARLNSDMRLLDTAQGHLDALSKALEGEQETLKALQTKINIDTEARKLLNVVGEEFFSDVLRALESMVTQGLRNVLGDETLELVLEQKISHNKIGVGMSIRSQMGIKQVETDVLSARGGGLAALVGFFIRLVLLAATNNRRVVVLDESFAHLSGDYEPILGTVLKQLCEQMGVQVLMVTHSTTFEEYADVVYSFRLHQGVTKTTGRVA